MPQVPQKLDYRSAPAAPQPGNRSAWQIIGCIWAWGLFTAALAFLVLILTPREEQVFRDFKASLPDATRVWLGVCSHFRGWVGWVALLPIWPAAVVLTWVRHNVAGRRSTYAWSRRLALLLIFGLVGAAVVCLGMPIVSLIDAVSGTKR
jgi:hypothetical protein